jgi:predicted nucleotidyltransferase
MCAMKLTFDEQRWIDAYRQVLGERFAGIVDRMMVYGSKARGDDRPDSDLDLRLIVDDHAARRKRVLRRTGYLLAATSDCLPSILVYTRSEWAQRKLSGSTFRKAVERDAVSVL